MGSIPVLLKSFKIPSLNAGKQKKMKGMEWNGVIVRFCLNKTDVVEKVAYRNLKRNGREN